MIWKYDVNTVTNPNLYSVSDPSPSLILSLNLKPKPNSKPIYLVPSL